MLVYFIHASGGEQRVSELELPDNALAGLDVASAVMCAGRVFIYPEGAEVFTGLVVKADSDAGRELAGAQSQEG